MKAEQSGINYQLPRIRIAPGEGDFEPFGGHLEIVFSGWTPDGVFEIYHPAKVRVNVSFGSNELDPKMIDEWAEVFCVAAALARGDEVRLWMPENVVEEYDKAVRTLAAQTN